MLPIPVPMLRGLRILPEVIGGDLDEGDCWHRLAEGGQQPLDGAAHEDALAGGDLHV